MKPLVFDLFCGLGGWSEAFIAEGYRAIGFDVEKHDYGDGGYPGELVLRDVRSITGEELVKQYGVPNVIVASPPCQSYSFMAMPWKKAKDRMRKIESDPAAREQLNDLFNQCFRIQREVSEAAGHYVPMIVENVRGAQRWVGKARWFFGSFGLWGDVPALMPIPSRAQKCDVGKCKRLPGANGGRVSGWPHKSEGHKTAGMNWSEQSRLGQDFTRIAGQQAEGEKGFKRNSRFNRATGQVVPGGIGDASNFSSKSYARKKASAEIAKIPPTLAAWIAKIFKRTAPFQDAALQLEDHKKG